MTDNLILFASSGSFEAFFGFLILVGILIFTFIDKKVKSSDLACHYIILSLIFLILVCINTIDDSVVLYNNSLIYDNLSKYGKIFICFTSIICLLGGSVYTKKKPISFEYYFIFSLAIFSMCALLSAYDFLMIFLCIELQSLSLYVLAAMNKNNTFSLEASLKYFILGSLASGFMVFGMSIIYALTGAFNVEDFSTYLTLLSLEDTHCLGVMFGILLFFCGLLFKIGGAPFHMWVPDVYEGSPSNVTLFFGVVPKLAVILFLSRICNYSMVDYSLFWIFIFIFSSIFSVILGSIGGLFQLKIKRLIAFSSINQVGYILLGLIGFSTTSTASVALYIILYALTTICLWFLIFSLKKIDIKNRNIGIVQYITDLTNLNKINSNISISFLIVFLSIAGVPPLGGFYTKAYIFFSALDSDLLFPVVIGVLASMVAIYYYLRVVKIIFFKGKFLNNIYYSRVPVEYSLVISFLIILISSFFIYGDFLILLSYVLYF